MVERRPTGGKDRILADNLAFFAGLDALVAQERHCRRLRTRHRLAALKLIHTRHGAGDREGTSDATMALFDLVLLPGRKYAERFVGLGYLRPYQYANTGWPKFEAVRALAPPPRRLFDNDNPIVVYNPHFDQRVGSWARMGRAVLDFFVAHPQYNLVFAPHLVLFRRRWRHRAAVPDRYRRAPNILVDTDSPAVGTDQYSDIAVLKTDGAVPAIASLGNSDKLDPGESVIAIGSPLGNFKNTVTVGRDQCDGSFHRHRQRLPDRRPDPN